MSLSIEYLEYGMVLQIMKITRPTVGLSSMILDMEWGEWSAVFVVHLQLKLNWKPPMFSIKNIMARVKYCKIRQVTSVTF